MAGRCNASQDTQDTWDAGDVSLASGCNADGSDAGSVFADVFSPNTAIVSEVIQSITIKVPFPISCEMIKAL